MSVERWTRAWETTTVIYERLYTTYPLAILKVTRYSLVCTAAEPRVSYSRLIIEGTRGFWTCRACRRTREPIPHQKFDAEDPRSVESLSICKRGGRDSAKRVDLRRRALSSRGLHWVASIIQLGNEIVRFLRVIQGLPQTPAGCSPEHCTRIRVSRCTLWVSILHTSTFDFLWKHPFRLPRLSAKFADLTPNDTNGEDFAVAIRDE